jgi:hypothetical protein
MSFTTAATPPASSSTIKARLTFQWRRSQSIIAVVISRRA